MQWFLNMFACEYNIRFKLTCRAIDVAFKETSTKMPTTRIILNHYYDDNRSLTFVPSYISNIVNELEAL